MEISSSPSASVQVEALKKAQDTQEQEGKQALKAMQSASKQSQEMSAQKTGMGGNLNITA